MTRLLTGKVTEAVFSDRVRRPGDEVDGYTIAEMTMRDVGGSVFLVLWEAVGEDLHSRRFLSLKDVQRVNFDRAETP